MKFCHRPWPNFKFDSTWSIGLLRPPTFLQAPRSGPLRRHDSGITCSTTLPFTVGRKNGWTAGPKFEEVGVIETGSGYRIRKLRYEIVPGFDSAALLYEPEHMSGKIPAILNVNGHVGPPGKAVEYKQKRCINYAKHGILALNLEWFSFGELDKKGNEHWFGAHLDLVGANELGIFYPRDAERSRLPLQPPQRRP